MAYIDAPITGGTEGARAGTLSVRVRSGQEAKAVNQLPMERVLDALKSGAAGSWALEHRSGNMLSGTFPLGFKLALVSIESIFNP